VQQDKRLYFQLNLAQQALRQRVDRECIARVGLTSAQAGLLFYVAQHDGCLLKDLASGLGLKNAAITGLVARTERTGCVRRQASREDARATLLHLTAKGRAKLLEIKRLNERFNEQLRDGFSAAELDVVLRFLQHCGTLAEASDPEAHGTLPARATPRHRGLDPG
jgi:MarR family transcriptional regulator, organic hydroperoxide resistance regulator